MSSSQELLDLVEAEIVRRLSAGGTEEWSEGGQRFRLVTTGELMAMREKLRDEVATSGRTAFRLAEFDPTL